MGEHDPAGGRASLAFLPGSLPADSPRLRPCQLRIKRMRRSALVVGIAVVALIVAGVFFRGALPSHTEANTGPASAATEESRSDADAIRLAPSIEGSPRHAAEREPIGEPTEEAPEGSILLLGRVFDLPLGGGMDDRLAAAGVKVGLSGSLSRLGEQTPPPETVTDSEGRFRLTLEDDGRRPRFMALWADGDAEQRTARTEYRLQEGE